MPVTTLIRDDFAKAVENALGGLTYNQAAYKTGLSDEYVRKMAKGRVPSEHVIERFANGLDADLHALRVAAGYEEPAPSDALKHALERMRMSSNGSPAAKADAERVVKELFEEVFGKQ